jgi:hypothetical protein
VGFDEMTVAVKPYGLSNHFPATIRIAADGTCVYQMTLGPKKAPPSLTHTLAPEQLQKLDELLKKTEWLTKPVEKDAPRLHSSDYTLTLKRDGKTPTLSFTGEPNAYKELMHFFNSLAVQEELLSRLGWPDPKDRAAARHELDTLISAEYGGPFAKSLYTIDLTRYVPWASRLIRKPAGEPVDDVFTAVRLVGLLKLESERKALEELARFKDWRVREAVAQVLGRLGGEKSIPVLKSMLPDTGDAAWELIKLGKDAIPTIEEVIRTGLAEEPPTAERLIRAYIDHWKEVSRPLDPKILEAVRVGMAARKINDKARTLYHAELLKLAAADEKK